MKNINFKFAVNWKQFLMWHSFYSVNGEIPWKDQAKKIEECFEPSNPNIVNWKQLWKDFAVWIKETAKTTGDVSWPAQKRQVETLMLNQLADLNQEVFVLVYLYKGKPEMDTNKMTYQEALAAKQELDGDSNGRGGDENAENVTIVNLKSLIK